MEVQEERIPTLFKNILIQFFIFILLFISLLQGQRNLIIFSIILLGIIHGANLWSRIGLSGIKCISKLDKLRVFPGEMFRLELKLENSKLSPIWLQVIIPLLGPLIHPSSEGSSDKILVNDSGLLWYQSVRFSWDLKAGRRGVYPVGPPQIHIGDILGFFPRELARRGDGLEIIVYPRLVPIRPSPLPRRGLYGIPGAKSPVQDPLYILGTRDYQGFSPARYIHWKASARQDRLQEKLFEPSEQEKVLLILEVEQFQKSKAREDFERTIEGVASLAVDLVQRGYAVGFVTDGIAQGDVQTILPLSRSPQNLTALLEILARLQMRNREDILVVLRSEAPITWGMSCVRFSFEQTAESLFLEEYFSEKKIPMTSFVCRSQSDPPGDQQVMGHYENLSQILMSEGEKV